ncbi:MAG: ThiF family adenylyltransferase, partial [Planctomycetaceae bacterium]|nr:ThiF family adenylyltransferase [Planctomycetaceae bacterium]
ELNPRLEIVPYAENISEENAAEIVNQVDLIIDCAPLFHGRFAMNRQAVLQKKPIIECAMYELEAQITTIIPGKTPCLACLNPVDPPDWKREFPVFGAVSGTVGCLAAMEAIKVISGIGDPLYSKMLAFDLRDMSFRKWSISRNKDCQVCGKLPTE